MCAAGEGETGNEENIPRHDGDDLKQDAVKTDKYSSRQAAHHHDRWENDGFFVFFPQ